MKEVRKVDWSKKDFIPDGIKAVPVVRKSLKQGDMVVAYGEIFEVLSNEYDKDQDAYHIKMIHTGDGYSKVDEWYIPINKTSDIFKKVIQ